MSYTASEKTQTIIMVVCADCKLVSSQLREFHCQFSPFSAVVTLCEVRGILSPLDLCEFDRQVSFMTSSSSAVFMDGIP